MTASKSSTKTVDAETKTIPGQLANGNEPQDVEETEEPKSSVVTRVREFATANKKLVLTVAGATAAFVTYKVVQARRAALTDEELEQETDGSTESA